jgi:hypothetical protein
MVLAKVAWSSSAEEQTDQVAKLRTWQEAGNHAKWAFFPLAGLQVVLSALLVILKVYDIRNDADSKKAVDGGYRSNVEVSSVWGGNLTITALESFAAFASFFLGFLSFAIYRVPRLQPVSQKKEVSAEQGGEASPLLAGGAEVGIGRICTTAHPLHTRFANIFGTSISEATMRPNPRARGMKRVRPTGTRRPSRPGAAGCCTAAG